MEQSEVIEHIRELGRQILPEGASLWLYGSRARGDARPDSDYDLLILLDKERITCDDHDNYCYPLFMGGLDWGAEISTHLYVRTDWSKWSASPFYKNVDEDKIVLI